MATALALRAALLDAAGVRASLKWPNDLLVGDKKIAGLLAETELGADGSVEAIVIGVGCNVQWTDFPPDIAGTATACNLEAGHDVAVADVLSAFLDRLATRLEDLGSVLADYRAALATLGREVRVDLGTREVRGVATAVDDSGRLVVTTDTGEEAIAVGDVEHLRHG
jgi:BirA family biotin operon repressor/biotin-[acetyl-CoA-carboxylase] ligase